MSAAELLADVRRRGIRLEAHGERLRFHPLAAVTPDLLDRLKAHKPELLALLRPSTERAAPLAHHGPRNRADDRCINPGAQSSEARLERFPLVAISREAPKRVCRCGSLTWRDVPIHGGQSIRRDCERCGRFLDFAVWYG